MKSIIAVLILSFSTMSLFAKEPLKEITIKAGEYNYLSHNTVLDSSPDEEVKMEAVLNLGLDKGLDGLGKFIQIYTNQSTLKKVKEDWKWDHITLINDSGRLYLKEVVFQDGSRVVENSASISK